MVVNSIIANNFTGISAQSSSSMYLAKNTITGNTTAFLFAGGSALLSFGDNDIRGNVNDNGAIPLASTK